MTFADEFCRQHTIAREDYEDAVLRRTLYPAARILYLFLAQGADYFASDRDFIRGVGRICRLDDFHFEAKDFRHHPDNAGFLRGKIRLRV